ncbi:MAG: transglutaminase family protein, partial [Betaproteobacteria bacterium]
MKIRIGYELVYDCPQPTPMILMLNVHFSRVSDLLTPDHMRLSPAIPLAGYRDSFGNWCTRILALAGETRISSDALIYDSGRPDPVPTEGWQSPVENLPEETLVYLLGSRYCETELLLPIAWKLFGEIPPGWPRVQAISNFVHHHIKFGYHHARPTKTAWEAYQEGTGVCRDFAHLGVTMCRAMNIPARYCTGYLPDIGVPLSPDPMDFAGWFEAFIDGRWYTVDPRNNVTRIGRILMARGRDAADVAITTTFGPNALRV